MGVARHPVKHSVVFQALARSSFPTGFIWDFVGLIPDQDGRYSLDANLYSSMENDEYRPDSLFISDEAGNTLDIEIEPNDLLIPGTELAVPKIRVSGGSEDLGPFFSEVRLDKNEYRPGETIKSSFKLDPASSKVWLVLMDFAHESESQSSIAEAGTPIYEEESFLNIPIPLDARPGTYYLSLVSASDEGHKHSSLLALPESSHFFNSGILVPRFTIR